MQALKHDGRELLTDDKLGAAATNIDDQLTIGVIAKVMANPEINQSRFLAPRNNLNGMAQNFFALKDEAAV